MQSLQAALLVALLATAAAGAPPAARRPPPPQLPSLTHGSHPPAPSPLAVPASLTAPGGRTGDEVPQFVIVSHDDAIKQDTYDLLRQLTDGKSNAAGCQVPITLFVKYVGTECPLLKALYDDGFEVADHTGKRGTKWAVEMRGWDWGLGTASPLPLACDARHASHMCNATPACLLQSTTKRRPPRTMPRSGARSSASGAGRLLARAAACLASPQPLARHAPDLRCVQAPLPCRPAPLQGRNRDVRSACRRRRWLPRPLPGHQARGPSGASRLGRLFV